MKPATVNEIKKQLKELDSEELIELDLRLARFKKENKELLSFLLFEAGDMAQYIQGIKEEMDEAFAVVPLSSLYLAKKSLRKILRIGNKYIRYTGDKTAETEILLHYAVNFTGLKLPLRKSPALSNLYAGVIKKIEQAIATLHEDLQYDYRRQLDRLRRDR